MLRVRILHASVNPDCYDLKRLSGMTFDEALEYFRNEDRIMCCNVEVTTVDYSNPNEFTFHAEGVSRGDGSDTMLNWCKVD